MVKRVLSIAILFVAAAADDGVSLRENCLACHERQKIPSELIYRRYLATYSLKSKMQQAIVNYLNDPKQQNSIMPLQFFLKFPMKERSTFSTEELRRDTDAFLDHFDIKKKLRHQKDTKVHL